MPARAHVAIEATLVQTVLGFAAGGWGLLMAVAPLLQIRRMLNRKSSEDVSLAAYGVLLPGFVLWIGYGTARTDWALVIPNTVALLVAIATVVVARTLRGRAATGLSTAGVPAPAPADRAPGRAAPRARR